MIRTLALILGLALPALPSQAQGLVVDLELVLAVDASGSVNETEYRLQTGGIAAGFRDPAVIDAIRRGNHGRIAVALVVWADATVPKDQSAWFTVSNAAEAEAFARVVETFPRRVVGGTGIGAGIAHSIRLIDSNAFQGTRRVVDVSGDGMETPPREFVVLIGQARDMARARGVTVNGLAILNEVPTLDIWYRNRVRTGPGSFVMTASGYEDFAAAMRAKLLREIQEQPPVASLALPSGE